MLTIDLSYFNTLGSMSPPAIIWRFFLDGGWIPILWALFWGFWEMFKSWRQGVYGAKRRFIFLAIDIPKAIMDSPGQSPLAVENFFAHLDGAHSTTTLWEKYWVGQTQDSFSFEIVSIEGYIQFVIRTRDKFRDLIEAAIYAQYPDAEITEVSDYAISAPDKYPDPEYKMFGTEWVTVKHEVYPLRTYIDFEDSLTKEFKDPMAAILENMAKMGKDEQLWYQIIITPISQKEWTKTGEKVVKKLIGAKVEEKKGLFAKIFDFPIDVIDAVMDQISGPGATAGTAKPTRDEAPSQMLYLSPGEKNIVEGIERKIGKIGFKVKIRVVYLAKKEVFKKQKAIHTMVGAIKQYNTMDAQSIKPEYDKIGTTAHYMFTRLRIKWKQQKLMAAYKARSNWRGAGTGFVLNTEELASLWHFPASWIKSPPVKKVESKRGVAPVNLPIEGSEEGLDGGYLK